MRCTEDILGYLSVTQQRLRSKLNEAVLPMLETWYARCIRDRKTTECCIIQANMAYLFKNITREDMNYTVVSTHVCSQVFLQHNFHFNHQAQEDEKLARAQADQNDNVLGIPLA